MPTLNTATLGGKPIYEPPPNSVREVNVMTLHTDLRAKKGQLCLLVVGVSRSKKKRLE